MLTAILLLPNAAFGEQPIGCATGVGNIGGSIQLVPGLKDTIGNDVFVTYEISVPNIGPPNSCDGEIGFFGAPTIEIAGVTVSDNPDCPPAAPGTILIQAGETKQLWHQSVFMDNVTLRMILYLEAIQYLAMAM
jgi:hypothetical protein